VDKQLQKQIDDAKSIYLFDGWYRLGDLKRMIAEAEAGERDTMSLNSQQLTLPEIGEKE
jgi:hypothetical protein